MLQRLKLIKENWKKTKKLKIGKIDSKFIRSEKCFNFCFRNSTSTEETSEAIFTSKNQYFLSNSRFFPKFPHATSTQQPHMLKSGEQVVVDHDSNRWQQQQQQQQQQQPKTSAEHGCKLNKDLSQICRRE
jgi:hypothetical protein